MYEFKLPKKNKKREMMKYLGLILVNMSCIKDTEATYIETKEAYKYLAE